MNEKEANHPAHPMDITANWCSHGGWFTLAVLVSLRAMSIYVFSSWPLIYYIITISSNSIQFNTKFINLLKGSHL